MIMLNALKSLLFPKVRVRIVVRINRPESLYALQNQLKGYGIPGFARAMPGNSLAIELEGNEANIRDRLNDLACSPHLNGSYAPQTDWLPYTGNFKHFSFSF